MNRTTVKISFTASLPVMAGYIVLGIGFGVLMSSKGYPILWTFLSSLFIYAGSMQYVGVGLISGGASLISAALMTILVNARHLFYGISMISRYQDMGWRKPYSIFALTDETYSLVCADTELPPEVDRKNYFFLVSLMNHCYWITGSMIGAFLGNALSFNSTGIDFSMTALFVVIVIDQWEKNRQHIPALLGLGISFLCLLLFGEDHFLLPAMLLITVSLFVLKKKIQGGAVSDD